MCDISAPGYSSGPAPASSIGKSQAVSSAPGGAADTWGSANSTGKLSCKLSQLSCKLSQVCRAAWAGPAPRSPWPRAPCGAPPARTPPPTPTTAPRPSTPSCPRSVKYVVFIKIFLKIIFGRFLVLLKFLIDIFDLTLTIL